MEAVVSRLQYAYVTSNNTHNSDSRHEKMRPKHWSDTLIEHQKRRDILASVGFACCPEIW